MTSSNTTSDLRDRLNRAERLDDSPSNPKYSADGALSPLRSPLMSKGNGKRFQHNRHSGHDGKRTKNEKKVEPNFKLRTRDFPGLPARTEDDSTPTTPDSDKNAWARRQVQSASKAESRGSVFDRLGTPQRRRRHSSTRARASCEQNASDGDEPQREYEPSARSLSDEDGDSTLKGRKKLFASRNPPSTGKPNYLKKDLETKEEDSEVLERRDKQIVLGKETDSYKHYQHLISLEKRTPNDPWTPRKEQKASRRCFDGQIKSWRRSLHKYNPSAPFDPKNPLASLADDNEDLQSAKMDITSPKKKAKTEEEGAANKSWFELSMEDESLEKDLDLERNEEALAGTSQDIASPGAPVEELTLHPEESNMSVQ